MQAPHSPVLAGRTTAVPAGETSCHHLDNVLITMQVKHHHIITMQVEHSFQHTAAAVKHTVTASGTIHAHHTHVHDLATHDRTERLPGPSQPDQVPAAPLGDRGDVQGYPSLLCWVKVQR